MGLRRETNARCERYLPCFTGRCVWAEGGCTKAYQEDLTLHPGREPSRQAVVMRMVFCFVTAAS